MSVFETVTQIYRCGNCLGEMSFEGLSLICDECGNNKVYRSPTGKIITIGIELEGGFNRLPDHELINYSTHEDSSVEVGDGDCGECCACEDGDQCTNRGYDFVGELVSSVMPITDWQDWVKQCYPSEHDSSCGTHVHLGVSNTSAYENCNSQEFHDYFVRELKAWGKRANIRSTNFWDRINGKNSMCSDEYLGKEQLAVRDEGYPSCRYCILNFQYHKHGTIEVRVLPVFDSPELTISAIKAVIKIFDTWLMKNGFSDIQEDTMDYSVMDIKGSLKSTVVREV